MNRKAVNPWPWSLQFGFNQGELVQDQQRVLFCAGQTSVDGSGAPQHVDDMGGQVELALDNLEAVLKAADMTLANVVRLTIFTTDMDAALENFAKLSGRLGDAGVTPAQTLIGVARLAFPGLMIELEATAVA